MTDASLRLFKPLLTAEEAFPALEQEFLAAKREVIAGFRIFDPSTKLRSPSAKAIGDTWFDLIVDTLGRGVKITLIISDFDPVVRMNNHIYTWTCLRRLYAAAEVSGAPHLLQACAAMHPAKVGFLPRLLLWPRTAKEMRKNLAEVNEKPLVERRAFLKRAPSLAPLLTWKNDQLVPRVFPPPLIPVTHHQKLAVFDNERLYIGGLDLNDRRYDAPTHKQDASDTWHDTQVLVDGPVAQEAADHLRSFRRTVSGEPPVSQKLLLRTISAKRRVSFPFLSPKPVIRTLAAAHAERIAKSQTLIYLETQFFRDRKLARQLAERASQNSALSLILILPAAPEGAAFEDEPGSDVAYGEHLQVKCLKILRDAFGARAFFGSPAQPRAVPPDGRATYYGAPIVYLHAKVSIFDDRHGIISSANLNGRSFAWDTEAGIATQNVAEVAHLKSRCFAHWLGPAADPACYDDLTACDAWAAQAALNAQTRPEDRKGLILPYSAAEAEALGYNLPGVPDEMV